MTTIQSSSKSGKLCPQKIPDPSVSLPVSPKSWTTTAGPSWLPWSQAHPTATYPPPSSRPIFFFFPSQARCTWGHRPGTEPMLQQQPEPLQGQCWIPCTTRELPDQSFHTHEANHNTAHKSAAAFRRTENKASSPLMTGKAGAARSALAPLRSGLSASFPLVIPLQLLTPAQWHLALRLCSAPTSSPFSKVSSSDWPSQSQSQSYSFTQLPPLLRGARVTHGDSKRGP